MATERKSRSRSKNVDNETPAEDAATQQASTSATAAKQGNKMSDTASIIEYTDDLAEAEAPVPLPKGDYPAEVRSAQIKTSGKGNDYVELGFFIDPEVYPADYTDGNPDGTILTYGKLSPENTQRARWGMKKAYEALGATMGKTLDLNDLLGKTAIVTVVHQDYEGEARANIQRIKAA